MHFLQESYKLVQESRILQKCYNVEHFLQDSDNSFAKTHFLQEVLTKNVMWYSNQNFKKIQTTSRNNHRSSTVAVYNAKTVSESQQSGQNCKFPVTHHQTTIHQFTPMQSQNTLIRLAAHTPTNWVTLDQK